MDIGKRLECKVIVSRVGKVEDYVNLPIIKNGEPIGVVVESLDVEYGYELKIYIFNPIGLETIDGRPVALSIDSTRTKYND